MRDIDEGCHGGRILDASERSGLPAWRILDFSASLNPLGPPPWLAEAAAEGLAEAGAYPDPDSRRARAAASRRYGLPAERFLFADGADSLVFALPRALRARAVLSYSPSYSGYRRAAKRAGALFVPVPLDESEGFPLDAAAMDAAIRSLPGGGAVLAFLGAPNNPVGASLAPGEVRALARTHPEAVFALDESFLELSSPRPESLLAELPGNCLVLRSLTKAFAMPGIRAGWASGDPGFLRLIRAELQAWPLSSIAERAAVKALEDSRWGEEGAAFVRSARKEFESMLDERLSGWRGFKRFPAAANYLLLRLPEGGSAKAISESLMRRGILVRAFSEAEGLDDSWIRVAVRKPEENILLVDALSSALRGEEA